MTFYESLYYNREYILLGIILLINFIHGFAVGWLLREYKFEKDKER